ncbi:hypothetical protein AK88_03884 [Plasmodium fragile]|uniref:RRM domain-containing protein n=1 Tax=Plasmodium fragile TaxID=5857 RepID=A0A0D9QHR1_PLAFR|nr:uncharacterized protein AK88_03884 [Plasmodium fragile]KJP86508.1 hypothetical protein AK88_03884 [Plasmodium fragile]
MDSRTVISMDNAESNSHLFRSDEKKGLSHNFSAPHFYHGRGEDKFKFAPGYNYGDISGDRCGHSYDHTYGHTYDNTYNHSCGVDLKSGKNGFDSFTSPKSYNHVVNGENEKLCGNVETLLLDVEPCEDNPMKGEPDIFPKPHNTSLHCAHHDSQVATHHHICHSGGYAEKVGVMDPRNAEQLAEQFAEQFAERVDHSALGQLDEPVEEKEQHVFQRAHMVHKPHDLSGNGTNYTKEYKGNHERMRQNNIHNQIIKDIRRSKSNYSFRNIVITNVFLGNIPPNITEERIKNVLEIFGYIIHIEYKWSIDKWSYAFVYFVDEKCAINAVNILNQKKFFDNCPNHKLICFIVSKQIPNQNTLHYSKANFSLLKDGPPGANLFLYGIPLKWTELNLIQLVNKYGHVVGLRIPYINNEHDKKQGNRGFGFVSYDNKKSAIEAFEELSKMYIHGKLLKVQLKNGEEHLLPPKLKSMYSTSVNPNANVNMSSSVSVNVQANQSKVKDPNSTKTAQSLVSTADTLKTLNSVNYVDAPKKTRSNFPSSSSSANGGSANCSGSSQGANFMTSNTMITELVCNGADNHIQHMSTLDPNCPPLEYLPNDASSNTMPLSSSHGKFVKYFSDNYYNKYNTSSKRLNNYMHSFNNYSTLSNNAVCPTYPVEPLSALHKTSEVGDVFRGTGVSSNTRLYYTEKGDSGEGGTSFRGGTLGSINGCLISDENRSEPENGTPIMEYTGMSKYPHNLEGAALKMNQKIETSTYDYVNDRFDHVLNECLVDTNDKGMDTGELYSCALRRTFHIPPEPRARGINNKMYYHPNKIGQKCLMNANPTASYNCDLFGEDTNGDNVQVDKLNHLKDKIYVHQRKNMFCNPTVEGSTSVNMYSQFFANDTTGECSVDGGGSGKWGGHWDGKWDGKWNSLAPLGGDSFRSAKSKTQLGGENGNITSLLNHIWYDNGHSGSSVACGDAYCSSSYKDWYNKSNTGGSDEYTSYSCSDANNHAVENNDKRGVRNEVMCNAQVDEHDEKKKGDVQMNKSSHLYANGNDWQYGEKECEQVNGASQSGENFYLTFNHDDLRDELGGSGDSGNDTSNYCKNMQLFFSFLNTYTNKSSANTNDCISKENMKLYEMLNPKIEDQSDKKLLEYSFMELPSKNKKNETQCEQEIEGQLPNQLHKEEAQEDYDQMVHYDPPDFLNAGHFSSSFYDRIDAYGANENNKGGNGEGSGSGDKQLDQEERLSEKSEELLDRYLSDMYVFNDYPVVNNCTEPMFNFEARNDGDANVDAHVDAHAEANGEKTCCNNTGNANPDNESSGSRGSSANKNSSSSSTSCSSKVVSSAQDVASKRAPTYYEDRNGSTNTAFKTSSAGKGS